MDKRSASTIAGWMYATRLRLNLACLALTLISAPASAAWPAWEQFAAGYIQDDGRVVDWTAGGRSISEAQAYALFFALVASDVARYDQILQWTENNLAQGDLGKNLPAWLWGQDADSRWRVLDPNSASDANLWLGYSLLEAGRLWNRPLLAAKGRTLLSLVAMHEVRQVADLTVLLPGRDGFESTAGLRLNPSYVPPFQLQYLAAEQPDGPWQSILDSYVRLLPDLTPGGRVPDWFLLTPDGPRRDEQSDGAGSYDAIRVFLWAGFGPAGLPQAKALTERLRPFAALLRAAGRTPERWYPDGRAAEGVGPPGFDAALRPFLLAVAASDLDGAAQTRLDKARVGDLIGAPARYYDQVLALFGEGFAQGRFKFAADGRLELP
ncbi:MAG: cellulose synthase complex periplasmic endoglucanase BcsZ [Panacagrimonas sp.]